MAASPGKVALPVRTGRVRSSGHFGPALVVSTVISKGCESFVVLRLSDSPASHQGDSAHLRWGCLPVVV